jgi:hypothetical protein
VNRRRLGAHEKVIKAVLDILALERCLADVPDAVDALMTATDTLELACRDLTNAVDDSPARERPRDWALNPDGRTA